MPVPLRLLAVDGEMDVDAVLLAPDVLDLREVDQILFRARAVDDVDLSVAVTVVAAVVDDRVQRGKTDAARDEQQVLARKGGVDREAVAVGAADGDLLAGLHGVEPFGHAAAFFDGELHIFLQRGAGRDGEQRLADARHGEHGALAGDVDEGLFAVEADHAEGLDVGRVDADIRDDGEIGDQRIRSHVVSSPSVLTTLTMFMWIGHFARHRPQPTQPKIPSLLSGK